MGPQDLVTTLLVVTLPIWTPPVRLTDGCHLITLFLMVHPLLVNHPLS